MKKFILSAAASVAAFAAFSAFEPTDYAYKVEFAASGYSGTSELADFPVLVRLNATAIADFRYSLFDCANGADLLFADADGNELPHEVDVWNPEGESLVWVKLPSLSGTATRFTMYLGNARGATGTFVPADVWTNRYAAVWHLNELGSSDATGHGLKMQRATNGTGTCEAKTGTILGNGYYNDGANHDRLVFDNPANCVTSITGSASALSVSCWAKAAADNLAHVDRLVCWKPNYDSTSGFELIKSANGMMLRGSSGSGTATPVALFTWANEWMHFAGVWDNATALGYANGSLCDLNKGSSAVVKVKKGDSSVGFGGMGGSSTQGYGFKGHLDELRFFNGIMSADWAKAEYDTAASSSFLSNGGVKATVVARITLGERPTVAVSSDGLSWTWTGHILSGAGDVYAIFTDVATGLSITNLADSAITGPVTVTHVPNNLDPHAVYSWAIYGDTSGYGRYLAGEGTFYNGIISVSASGTADEATGATASFVFTRDASSASVAKALSVPYVVSGTAVNGRTCERLSGTVAFAAGESTATVVVKPIADNLTTADTTLTVTVAANAALPGASPSVSATVTIVDDPDAAYDLSVRYLATDGDDGRDGTTPGTAKATLGAVLEALGASGGTIRVADGTYVDSVSSPTLYTIETPVVLESVSGRAESVVFTKGEQSARIFRLAHKDAVLRNITVRNGGFRSEYACGGNVYMTAGTIDRCVVSGGSSGNVVPGDWEIGGGNIYMTGGTVTRSVITNGLSNTDRHYGTGLYMTGGRLDNSLVAYNRNNATDGGAIRMAGNAAVYNCTVVSNTSTYGSPAFFFGRDQTSPRIYNTVIWGNILTTGGRSEPHAVSRYGSNFYNCASDAAIEDGHACLTPSVFGFADPANGDFSLTVGSQLIDQGSGDAVTALFATDLAGKTRLSGTALDLGAYEYDQSAGYAGISASADSVLASDGQAAITFTPIVSCSSDYSLAWDFGDGSVLTNEAGAVTHVYTAPGEYSVYLTVLVDGEMLYSVVYPSTVKICPEVLYAKADGGAGTVPYDTPAKGSSDIQALIDYALAGATIVIAPGTYERVTGAENGNYILEKRLVLRGSTSRPEDVILRVVPTDAGHWRNLKMIATGAVVSSVTFENGQMNNYSGGGIYMTAGTITNCIVRNCRVNNFSDTYLYGGGIYMTGGVVTHTRVLGTGGTIGLPRTSKKLVGVNGLALAMDGGLCDNCYFGGDYDNVTNPESSLRIAGNFVYVAKGRLENCTIAGRALRYDCETNDLGVATHDKALYVGAEATAVNCVIADMSYYCEGAELAVPDGATPELLNAVDSRGTIVNCAFDTLAAPNDTCVQASAATLFANPAAGDYRPRLGGPLVGAGSSDVTARSLDLGGGRRMVGAAIDIGCFEASGGFMLIVR